MNWWGVGGWWWKLTGLYINSFVSNTIALPLNRIINRKKKNQKLNEEREKKKIKLEKEKDKEKERKNQRREEIGTSQLVNITFFYIVYCINSFYWLESHILLVKQQHPINIFI